MSEIIDVVLGLQERRVLDFRLRYLATHVKKFYVGEARFTHQGGTKELFFSRWKADGRWKSENLEIVEIPPPCSESALGSWGLERHSREWLVGYVAKRHPRATLLVCDLDEIPSREQLDWIKDVADRTECGSLPMKLAYRRANWVLGRSGHFLWNKAFFVIAPALRKQLREKILPLAPGEPGLHMSYVDFSAVEIAQKLRSFAHTEFAGHSDYQPGWLNLADSARIDHLGRYELPRQGLLLTERQDQLNDVQRFALEFDPRWFEFSPLSWSRYQRVSTLRELRERLSGRRMNEVPNSRVSQALSLARFYIESVFFGSMASLRAFLSWLLRHVGGVVSRALRL